MLLISLSIPLALLLWALFWPFSARPVAGGLDFMGQMAQQNAPIPLQTQSMRDGYALPIRALYGPEGAPLLVMIHGSGWHGMQFEGLAAQLAPHADILIPDLRGHGIAPQRRGDVDYIGQFEDDLADLITARAKPGQKVVLLGHSSGGGLVIRFAGGAHGDMIAGAVLLAPFVHHSAPTTRPNSGGWAQTNLRRIIALSLLNRIGFTALNHLPIIHFAMPRAVLDGPLGATATLAYSYRLNTSFAPRENFGADIAALPPFVLIAGAADEAFFAAEYAPLFGQFTQKGRYETLPDTNHLGVVSAAGSALLITQFLQSL